MADFWTEIYNFAQTTTARIGTKLLADYGQLQPDFKADGSLVTQADKWADQEIQNAIYDHFPSHDVLTEEGSHVFSGAEWCWVIDPIDGTTNFTRGIPIWGISLGLVYQGMPIFGYVHFPNINQSFHGYWYGDSQSNQSNGAFLNNIPIRTSKDAPSNSHFFNLCSRSTAILQKPIPCKVRILGVTTYDFLSIATGAALGSVESTPKVWDLAAVWPIVQAAGGVFVTLGKDAPFPLQEGEDYGDRSYPTLVVSRPELVPTFKPLVEFLGKR
jgi:myo-inositol-1(or 4)-monophosphatase